MRPSIGALAGAMQGMSTGTGFVLAQLMSRAAFMGLSVTAAIAVVPGPVSHSHGLLGDGSDITTFMGQ